jgi:hypothetical protein
LQRLTSLCIVGGKVVYGAYDEIGCLCVSVAVGATTTIMRAH